MVSELVRLAMATGDSQATMEARRGAETGEKVAREAEALRGDARARIDVGEALMKSLLRLDAVRGAREYRRRVALLELLAAARESVERAQEEVAREASARDEVVVRLQAAVARLRSLLWTMGAAEAEKEDGGEEPASEDGEAPVSVAAPVPVVDSKSENAEFVEGDPSLAFHDALEGDKKEQIEEDVVMQEEVQVETGKKKKRKSTEVSAADSHQVVPELGMKIEVPEIVGSGELEMELEAVRASARAVQLEKEVLESSFDDFKLEAEMYKQEMKSKLWDKLNDLESLQSGKAELETKAERLHAMVADLDQKHVALVAEVAKLQSEINKERAKKLVEHFTAKELVELAQIFLAKSAELMSASQGPNGEENFSSADDTSTVLGNLVNLARPGTEKHGGKWMSRSTF